MIIDFSDFSGKSTSNNILYIHDQLQKLCNVLKKLHEQLYHQM